jgi:hypothetical protein
MGFGLSVGFILLFVREGQDRKVFEPRNSNPPSY